MNRLCAAAVVVGVCGAALATPRETVTWTNVVSEGLINAPVNSVRTVGFSGSYTANKVRISGTLRSGGGYSWAWDSRLLITTPWGATFSVQPFTQEGEFTTITTPGELVFDVPNPAAAAGTWTVRFYEYYDDDGVDASWDSVTVTLDDEPAPAPTVLAASGGVYHEVEDNDRKIRANVIPAISDGESIVGNTTGSSTSTPGAASPDYYRVRTAAAPLGIYKHRLVLTSATPGQAVTLRGLSQVDGSVIAGSDVGFQFGLSFTNPPQVAQWYGFGRQEEVYYAVSGDSTTTADYTATYSRTGVTPLEAGSLYAGMITIDRAPGDIADVDMMVYDSNFDPVRGYANDGQDSLTRSFAPGEYYLAISTWNTSNDQPAPADDSERNENVLDFPNVVACSAVPTNPNVSVRFTDPTMSPVVIAASKSEMYQVIWVHFTVVPLTATTSPRGFGAAAPSRAYQTRPALLTVSVEEGANPVSTGVSVVADLSSLGLSSSQAMYDDGTHGDIIAGDGRYSYLATIAPAASPGAANLSFSVSDAQGRSSSGSFGVTVLAAPAADQWDEAFAGGDAAPMPGGTIPIDGSGPLNVITGNLAASDADMYRIYICDPASFSATTMNGTIVDTQLFLFREDGTGVTMDDDDPATQLFQSTLSHQFVTTPGIYYLAVSEWGKDPVDSAQRFLWLDTVGGSYAVEHAPDGPGAANPISTWNFALGGGGPYAIYLTGVCRGEPVGGGCGSADFNCDGDVATDADIEAFFACIAGNCPAAPCPSNADFNGDGDAATDADIEAFFRVLAGGTC
jgi:hypothetical protein